MNDQDPSSSVAIAVIAAIALSLLGMFAYARGPAHHHGDAVGSRATKVIVVTPEQ